MVLAKENILILRIFLLFKNFYAILKFQYRR